MKVPYWKLRTVAAGASYYSAEDVAAIIAAVPGGLPCGPVDIQQASPEGNGSIPFLVERRALLVNGLEAAAARYLRRQRLLNGPAPSQIARRMQAIETATRELIEALGLDDNKDADDIPAEILVPLRRQAEIISAGIRGAAAFQEVECGVYAGPSALRNAVQGIQFLQSVAADAKLMASFKVNPDARRNKGNEALHGLFGDLVGVWIDVFERPISMSVGKPGSKNEGIPNGPLIRFFDACLKPIQIEMSPDAIRERLRPFQRMVKSMQREI